ncbi:YHYH domain-containing protein [Ascidiaceihabitans sp.]|nr:YHYH domain-containing protein [Ascidiaceihabitans sp.]
MTKMLTIILTLVMGFSTQADAHTGGLNKQGCHAGSKPYHCHGAAKKVLSD